MAMRRPIALAAVLALTACPLGPKKSEETDDGAEGDTGATETGTPGAAPASEPPAPADPTCEAELERVKAELAECRATK